jgi:hypothetical protein
MNKNSIISILRYVAVVILGLFGGYQAAPVPAPLPVPTVEGRCVQVVAPPAAALAVDATVTQ